MKRREFITLLGGAVAAWPVSARAQQNKRMRRIGMLMSVSAEDSVGKARVEAFLQSLQQLGWIEGRSAQIDIRWGAGDTDGLRRYAAELVTLAPDVIPCLRRLCHGAIVTGNTHRADRVYVGH